MNSGEQIPRIRSFVRTISFQSGIFKPRDALQSVEKVPPLGPERRNLLSAGSREPVATAAASVAQGLPFRLDPAPSFQPVEHRVKRSHIELQHASRLLLD